ncbi:MAG: hypothetical protein NT090_08895, partial [Acidobacteria bacterium]|nr:hypothetical protein [Acidobacteriota bacterium]
MKTPSKREAPAPKAGKTAKGPIAPAGPSQEELFAQASGLFHSGRFGEAKALFAAASEGAIREMAHSARLHIRMCDQRLGSVVPELATAEERYNYAVALMNRREFQ